MILSRGPHASMPHIDLLKSSIEGHHALYVRIYPDGVKPKFHQLLHIPEDMMKLGSLMACFVTERKHRHVKSNALNVFRHYEHTVIFDVVAQQLDHLCDDALYTTMALIDEVKVTAGGVDMFSARAARFPCGEVNAGDLVFYSGRSVGRVQDFWRGADEDGFVVHLQPLLEIAAGTRYGTCGADSVFVAANEISDVLTWAESRPGVFRVCQAFGMVGGRAG